MNLVKVVLLSIVFVGLLSCGNDDDLDVVKEEFLTAVLNGESFEDTGNKNNAALYANVQQGANGMMFSLRGVNEIFGESDIVLRCSVSNYTGVGNYTLENSDLRFSVIGNGYNANTYINAESTGFLNISRDDGEFYEGTFEFVAYAVSGNQATLTDGVFKIKFQ